MVPLNAPRHAARLFELPQDILLAICSHLPLQRRAGITTVARLEKHAETGFFDWFDRGDELLPLSMTCRSLRKLCLPIIFRVCVLDTRTEKRVVPQSVSVFTRRLHLYHVSMKPSQFRNFLCAMPSLREVYVTNSAHLLPTLLETAALDVVALRDVPMSRPLDSFTVVSAPLRTLRILSEDRILSLEAKAQAILAESEWLLSLLPLVRHTLEELVLPAESMRLSCLCAAPWPMLRELVILGAFTLMDAPLSDLLAMLPRLRDLTLAAIRRQDLPRMLLWPPDTHSQVNLSALRRLALSFVSGDDEIFAHLPPALEELALRDYPRLFIRGRLPKPQHRLGTYAMYDLTCGTALAIFQRLETARLRRLELVVIDDERALELLSYLASNCPSLVSFELHLYRHVSDSHAVMHDPPSLPLTTLATSLSAFTGLKVLRLNIEYPLSQVRLIGHLYPYSSTSAQFSEGIARAVALHMPQLMTIGVLGVINMNIIGWRMWNVSVKCGMLTLTLDCEKPDR